jgi:hypothetical protein
MLNEKIKRLEEEKKKLVEERTGIEDRSTDDLERVTAEAVARHLVGRLLPRPVQPGPVQGALEAVVQEVTVEGPARARLRLDLPIRPLEKFDRAGPKWCLVWRPQRDSNPCRHLERVES